MYFFSKAIITKKNFKKGEIVRIFDPKRFGLFDITFGKLYYVKSYNVENNIVKIVVGKKGNQYKIIKVPDAYVIKITGPSKATNEIPPEPVIEEIYGF